jgi:hypothetical protein
MKELEFNNEYDDIEVNSISYGIGDDNELTTELNVDENELTHLDKIKIAANAAEITLQDPKKNCRKCGGRGYTGFRSIKGKPFGSGQPIVCKCMFVKDEKATIGEQREVLHGGGIIRPTLNREQRRKVEKRNRRHS